MIAIVDYGVGNLFSLSSSLKALGLETEITGDAARLQAADRIILPGVGAFGDAKAKLDATGLVDILRAEAEKKPFLVKAWNMASTRVWASCPARWQTCGTI